jgi:sugar fermentation stimulation protein A
MDAAAELEIGRLGTFLVQEGYYLYVGSALGGLQQRLARYEVRCSRRLHWHIDYLLTCARVLRVWSFSSADRLECAWARAALRIPNANIPIRKFGASDCSCTGHLIHFPEEPDHALFARLIGLRSPDLLKVKSHMDGV